MKYLKAVLVFSVQQLLCQDRAAVTHSTYRVQGKVPREGGTEGGDTVLSLAVNWGTLRLA